MGLRLRRWAGSACVLKERTPAAMLAPLRCQRHGTDRGLIHCLTPSPPDGATGHLSQARCGGPNGRAVRILCQPLPRLVDQTLVVRCRGRIGSGSARRGCRDLGCGDSHRWCGEGRLAVRVSRRGVHVGRALGRICARSASIRPELSACDGSGQHRALMARAGPDRRLGQCWVPTTCCTIGIADIRAPAQKPELVPAAAALRHYALMAVRTR